MLSNATRAQKIALAAYLLVAVVLGVWMYMPQGPVTPVVPVEPPIVAGKIAVLILEESSGLRPQLPSTMTGSWFAADVRDWAEANCDVHPEYGVEFKVLQKDDDFSQLDAKWADVIREHPPERYPWLYVSNGKQGADGDPRKDKAELMAVMKKYRGVE